jgi:hypothetical protein
MEILEMILLHSIEMNLHQIGQRIMKNLKYTKDK